MLCRYCVSRSSTGTLSFMEWESVLRLVGINLGDHFSAHMTHRVGFAVHSGEAVNTGEAAQTGQAGPGGPLHVPQSLCVRTNYRLPFPPHPLLRLAMRPPPPSTKPPRGP